MSISCIIVDDEPYAGNLLEEYILQVPYLRLEKKCLTAMEALDFLQRQVVDLVFLDINLHINLFLIKPINDSRYFSLMEIR